MWLQSKSVGCWVLLSGCLLTLWHMPAVAKPVPCQESLVRFLTEMYLHGAYCSCAVTHHETVTEAGRIRRQAHYTLPGLSIRQPSPLPDLSKIEVRFWGKVVNGPGGEYTLSVRIYEVGREAEAVAQHREHIEQGQEFELTDGPQQRLLLQTRTPYHVTFEGQNPQLRPKQQLTLQGRACFYLVSGS
ncbi:MAG: hypothetical protein V3S24_20530 [Candidatus Tectomicrobia bacterium]